jgi:hypothetical protein
MSTINYLLSVENLKKLGLIHSNTDAKLLSVAIKRSQDMADSASSWNSFV